MSTPREIEFDDIRKGDDIEARWAVDGLHLTRRGVAHHRNPLYWYTEEGGRLASSEDERWTHYLHHRPAPAEPGGLGAVVRARPLGTLTDATDLYVRFAERRAWGCTWIRVGEWRAFRWAELDPESIEVLSEGIEVEP